MLCGLTPWGSGTYTADGIIKIAEMLKSNTTLQSIKYAPFLPYQLAHKALAPLNTKFTP